MQNRKILKLFLLISFLFVISLCWFWHAHFTCISWQEWQWRDKLSYANNYLQIDLNLGHQDASHKYNTHMFIIVGTKWKELSNRMVCIATQASLDHLHWLVNITSTWTGPVSIAIFVPDIEFQLAHTYVLYLQTCFPTIREQVSFHFVYPLDRPPELIPSYDERQSFNCSYNYRNLLDELLLLRPAKMMATWRQKLPYPQNLLRNTARNSCQNPYVMCSDADMFSTLNNLEEQLETFLSEKQQKECIKCAYVIPVYEIKISVPYLPRNKTELLQYVANKTAQPFHMNVFALNQGLSNLPLWERRNESLSLNVSHIIDNYQFWYEPIYVSPRNNPPFDERFIGFGNTRNTQVYEMFLADWKFKVLNNAFLIHWGFQNLKSRPPWRRIQAGKNLELFRSYVMELAVRYDKDPLNLIARYGKKNTKMKVIQKPLLNQTK